MENLILGSLITVVGYLLYKYNKLEKFNHQNYNSINGLLSKNQEIFKLLSKIKISLNDLDKQMKDDSYKSLSDINKSLEETKSNHDSLVQTYNTQDLAIQESFGTVAKNFQSINSDIFIIKQHIENTIT